MNGYRVNYNLLDARTCDRLVSEATLMWPEKPWRVSMPHRKSDVFLMAMRLPQIVHEAEKSILECDGLGSDYFFHPPGTPGMRSHRDNDYVQADPHSMVSIWIALCDVFRGNGCLHVDDADIALPKGGAVILSQECLHGSRDNESANPRHALLLTYIGKGAAFNPGQMQKRTRVPLRDEAMA